MPWGPSLTWFPCFKTASNKDGQKCRTYQLLYAWVFVSRFSRIRASNPGHQNSFVRVDFINSISHASIHSTNVDRKSLFASFFIYIPSLTSDDKFYTHTLDKNIGFFSCSSFNFSRWLKNDSQLW